MTELLDIAQKLSGAGLAALLILILWGGKNRIWVWGWHFEQMCAERDEWKHIALQNTNFAERAVNLVSKQ